MSSQAPANERHSVTVSALIFASGTMLSRILGLIRDMMTARYFSPEIRDAFLVAFRLPNVFRRLLGEGSFSISFIPVFVGLVHRERKEEAHRLVNSLFAILATLTLTLSLLGVIFMEDILRFLVSGQEYMSIAGKFELTVRLARIMFGFIALISAYAFFMAILNSFRKFVLTAFAPCLFNVAMISAAFVSSRWAAPEEILAWAVLAGGFLQMALLVPSVFRLGYFPKPTLKWASPELFRVLKTMIPGLLGVSLMQVSQVINIYFASFLPQGTHSALYFADRVLELPLSLFVVSMSSALLPTLARYWAAGEKEKMAQAIEHSVCLILFVAVPAAVGMFVLAVPISEVLFMGREFTMADAWVVAGVIEVYAFGLLVAGGVRIFAQGFYAIQNTWYPALAAGIAAIAHLFFAFAFTKAFGIKGLAGATVCSGAVNLVMLLLAYRSWVGRLDFKMILKRAAKFFAAALVMAVVIQMYGPLVRLFGPRHLMRTLSLLITITSGVSIYALAAHFLKAEELRETLELVSRKLAKVKK